MLEELYKKGYLNIEKMILDNTKALGITAEEAVILLCILKNNSLSIDNIQNNLLITFEKLDKIMTSLMERGFYEIYLSYDNGKGTECVSFVPLFDKLEAIINKKEETDDYDIAKANQYLSSKMNRILSSSELEILQSLMLDDHYSYDDIVYAATSIIENKRALTMRTLTAKLADKKAVVMPKKETPKELKEFFNKI